MPISAALFCCPFTAPGLIPHGRSYCLGHSLMQAGEEQGYMLTPSNHFAEAPHLSRVPFSF